MDIMFDVTNTAITRTDKNNIVADSVNYIDIYFNFLTDEWAEGIKTAYFKPNNKQQGYSKILDENNHCIVDVDILTQGHTSIGVGIVNGDTIIYSDRCYVRIIQSAKIEVSDLPYSADLYEQVMAKLEEATSEENISEQINNAVNDYFEKNPVKPYDIGNGLKFEDNVLSVDVANVVEEDNTKPISSAAVYTTVGNIDALLQTI